MKKYAIYGFSKEIEKYDREFMEKIDYFIGEKYCDIKIYKGKSVKNFEWLLNQKNIFIFISEIFNRNRIYKKLEEYGLLENKNFIWAPKWFGDENIPSCYPMKSWEDNEKKYDFSKIEGPWDFRYKELLTLMPVSCSAVMDCGAGNMSLRSMLNKEISYYPIDKIKKYQETIVCDFNSGNFPEINVDVIFLAGILEYIICPESFLRNVCQSCKTVLMSYCTLHTHPEISSRMLCGWKNHFVMGELIKLFSDNGFCLVEEIYEEIGGVYLRFDKNIQCC